MKYIIKNIKKFIKDDTFIFLLVILTVSISCFMIHFSYGIYQNYHIKKENADTEKLPVIMDVNYTCERIYEDNFTVGQFKVNVGDIETITLDMVEELLLYLGEDIYENFYSIDFSVSINGFYMICLMGYSEDGFYISDEILNSYNTGMLYCRGELISREQYKNGEHVAVVFDYHNINKGNSPLIESMLIDENHIEVGGKTYEIIGYNNHFPEQVMVPVTTLPGNTPICSRNIGFYFYDTVTVYEYNKICEGVELIFGDLATVRPMKLPDTDTIRLYNTIIVIAIAISILAALNFAILYRYILSKRYRQISCMRLCGMSYGKTICTYLIECLAITMPVYVITCVAFEKLILPWLSELYKYGFRSFNVKIYLVMFGIYFGVSIVILLIMLCGNIKKNVLLCEGKK